MSTNHLQGGFLLKSIAISEGNKETPNRGGLPVREKNKKRKKDPQQSTPRGALAKMSVNKQTVSPWPPGRSEKLHEQVLEDQSCDPSGGTHWQNWPP